MSLGLIYWLCMLIWLVFGLWTNWPVSAANARPIGGTVLLFILLLVIGWAVFGSPIKT